MKNYILLLIATTLLFAGCKPPTLAETIAESIKSDTSQWKIVEYRDTIQVPKWDSANWRIQKQIYMNTIMLDAFSPQKIRIENKSCNILIEGESYNNYSMDYGLATLIMKTPKAFAFNSDETGIILQAYKDAIVTPRDEAKEKKLNEIRANFIAQHEKEGREIASKLCK